MISSTKFCHNFGSSYTVDVLIGPRFGDSNIIMREVNYNFPFYFMTVCPEKKFFSGVFGLTSTLFRANFEDWKTLSYPE